jgi:hypothetical protein
MEKDQNISNQITIQDKIANAASLNVTSVNFIEPIPAKIDMDEF